MYKNYLKTYQDKGEVKLTFDEWCTQNGGGLCESDLTKAQEAYAQYSDDFDIKGIQFNKSDNNSDPNSVKFNNTISAEEKIFNAPNKKLDLKNIKFNFEYNLNDVSYKKGGQLNLNLNQQIKFYRDYVNGSFDNGPKEKRANHIFKKLNKMYHLETKKTGGNVLGYLQSLARI